MSTIVMSSRVRSVEVADEPEVEAVKVCISNDSDEPAQARHGCRRVPFRDGGDISRVNAAQGGRPVRLQGSRRTSGMLRCRETTLGRIVRMRCACVAVVGGQDARTLDRYEGTREAPLNEKEGPRGGAFFLYESNREEGVLGARPECN